jgi:hypothetical protein
MTTGTVRLTLCDDAMSVHGEADPLKPFDVRPWLQDYLLRISDHRRLFFSDTNDLQDNSYSREVPKLL